TRDLNLGKVALYQLSYSRAKPTIIAGGSEVSIRSGGPRSPRGPRGCKRGGAIARLVRARVVSENSPRVAGYAPCKLCRRQAAIGVTFAPSSATPAASPAFVSTKAI